MVAADLGYHRAFGHFRPMDRGDPASADTPAVWKSRLSEMGPATRGGSFHASVMVKTSIIKRDKRNQRTDELLSTLLPSDSSVAIPHIKPYFLTSFGSFGRMDYGTGHETSFALFLLCLTLIRFFKPVPEDERDIVFRVFVRYMRLCWKLQDVYKLEPAGSHGVWGLDDYCFLGYIFGSGQLRGWFGPLLCS